MATTSRSSNAAAPAPASRSDRDRLRDYYGLADTTNNNAAGSSSSSSSSANPISPPSPASPSLTTSSHQPRNVTTTTTPNPTTLPLLLSHHSSLLTSMRELDGERQSLVYNHHGDLVAASQTMERLRDSERSGGGLEESLGALKRSTEALGKWEGQLRGMLGGVTVGRRMEEREDAKVDIAKEVLPIVTLPQRLRDVAALRGLEGGADDDQDSGESVKGFEQGLAAAEALWGRHESILSTWSSQGVQGASAVADECRGVLREQRERVAEATATMAAVGSSSSSSSMARRREQQQQQQA